MSLCPRVRLPVCLPVCLSVCLFSGLGSRIFPRGPTSWELLLYSAAGFVGAGSCPCSPRRHRRVGARRHCPRTCPLPDILAPTPHAWPPKRSGRWPEEQPCPPEPGGVGGARSGGGVRSWLCPPCPRVCVRTRRGRPGTCGLCPRWPPLPSARRHATRVGRGRALRQLLGETLARFRPPLPAFWLSAGSREPPAAPLTLCRRPFWAKPGAPVGVQLTLPRVMLGVGP